MEKGEEARYGILAAITKVKGILDASLLLRDDVEKILAIEEEAEERSLMGLGKVVNTGVRQVLEANLIYVALTSMDFDWGCHSTLILKKNQEIVGREVRDEEEIAHLSKRNDVWFMHRNFVVLKEKISFPHDIMKNLCYFEIPPVPCDWLVLDPEASPHRDAIFSNPATPSDVYLKERYFKGRDERGLGTILIGVKLPPH